MGHGGIEGGRARYSILAIASALALAACSLALDANAPQCAITDDCVARGAAFATTTCVDSRCAATPPVSTLSSVDAGTPEAPDDPADPWRCVGRVSWPAPTNEPLVDHEVFTHFLSRRVVAGLQVEVCARADVDCTSPLASVTSDATGAADLPITKGFTGYLQLKTPPASFPGLMPTIAPYVLPAGTDPAARSQLCVLCDAANSAMIFAKSDLTGLAAALATALDPSRGLLLAFMVDCDNRVQAGIQLEVDQADEKGTRFYVEDSLPTLTRTETSATGQAGYVNLQPGLVSVTARLASTGKVIGSRTVLVRAGTFTVFFYPPTPL